MAFARRIFLWILVNISVIALFSIIASIFNVGGYLGPDGSIYIRQLMFFALFFGFAGSIISLLISKWMVKRSMNVQIITTPNTNDEAFIFQTIKNIANQQGLGMPEVGIYPSNEVNAFATGWNKNNALVAVSEGLLARMNKAEIEGVLGHEMAHIANGDMVTMTLLQGVINTFVIFIARAIGAAVARNDDGISYGIHYGVSIVLEIVFGFFAGMIVMAFSRWREYRADAGSAAFVGRQKMIAALTALSSMKGMVDPTANKNIKALKINGGRGAFMGLLMSHPPLEKRIEALRRNA